MAQQKLAYPRATYVSTGYSKNNCHAYAWTGRQDIWMQSPVLYVSDGSYKAIKGRPKSNGQIAVWGSYTHSAIVTNYGTQDPTVTSKWGGGHIWRCGQVIVHIMDQFAIMEDKVSLEITYYVSY